MAVQTRARGASQKALRRENILDAAEQLFQTSSYADISMHAVSDVLGLSKGTLYLYFESKESLFLGLTERALNSYFSYLITHLPARPSTPESLAKTMVNGFKSEKLLPQYLSNLHTVFEHNVEYETVLAFKKFLLGKVERTGLAIDTVMEWPVGSGSQALIRGHALVIGLQHMAAPSLPVAKALLEPELKVFRIDFVDSLSQSLPLLLKPV